MAWRSWGLAAKAAAALRKCGGQSGRLLTREVGRISAHGVRQEPRPLQPIQHHGLNRSQKKIGIGA